jgi:hypothetical protein
VSAKGLSRTKRWERACAAARDALEELGALQEEYQEWRDNLPENLEGGTLAEKLDAVADLDIQSAIDVVDECEGADLPLGFGRD